MKHFLGCLIVVAFVASLVGLPSKQTPVAHAASHSAPILAAPKPKPHVLAAAVPKTAQAPRALPKPIVFTPGCAQYLPLVEQYNWNARIATAIMQAESTDPAGPCDPNAVSPLNYDGLRDYGLFQIHGEPIMRPAANVARAYQKYLSQGWQAWSTYNSGKYQQYLR